MKVTINDLIRYAKANGLNLDAEIMINGCELHYIFNKNGIIYLDETENGDNE